MVGLSYPGLAQLWVASTRPPSLAAITPMSVIADTYRSTLAPGGITNKGFAVEWAKQVSQRAGPYGQGWERVRADAGDAVCAENQKLHSQRVDVVTDSVTAKHYDPTRFDPLNPSLFVDRINVPVFLAGAFQDEQTGGHFATLLEKFAGSPIKKFTLYNGLHADAFAPQIVVEWKAFLDFTLQTKLEPISPAVRLITPAVMQGIFGAPLALPAERWLAYPDFATARAAWLAEPPVQVIFENGGGSVAAAPEGRFSGSFAAWPPPAVTASTWYLAPGGALLEQPASPVSGTVSSTSFTADPAKASRTTYSGASEGVWRTSTLLNWAAPAAGTERGFRQRTTAQRPRARGQREHRPLDRCRGRGCGHRSGRERAASRRTGDVHPVRIPTCQQPGARHHGDRVAANTSAHVGCRTAVADQRVRGSASRGAALRTCTASGISFEDLGRVSRWQPAHLVVPSDQRFAHNGARWT